MLELQFSNDSIGIRLKSAVHPGKKFLATIFSAIVYCRAKALPGRAYHYHSPVIFDIINANEASKEKRVGKKMKEKRGMFLSFFCL